MNVDILFLFSSTSAVFRGSIETSVDLCSMLLFGSKPLIPHSAEMQLVKAFPACPKHYNYRDEADWTQAVLFFFWGGGVSDF